ncbi:MAG: PEGA domain-containing protein, partial [Myxococcales bacterium]
TSSGAIHTSATSAPSSSNCARNSNRAWHSQAVHWIGGSSAGYKPHSVRTTVEGGKSLVIDLKLRPELHEGTLNVLATKGAWVSVDGKRVGADGWRGRLASGSHTVQVSAPGKHPYSADAVIQDGQVTVLHVNLQDASSTTSPTKPDRGGISAWVWVGTGAVVIAGAVVGYLLLKPEPNGPPEPVEGTLGKVPLGIRF